MRTFEVGSLGKEDLILPFVGTCVVTGVEGEHGISDNGCELQILYYSQSF